MSRHHISADTSHRSTRAKETSDDDDSRRGRAPASPTSDSQESDSASEMARKVREMLADMGADITSSERTIPEAFGDPLVTISVGSLMSYAAQRKGAWETAVRSLLTTINEYELETPKQMEGKIDGNLLMRYRVMFGRWLVYCRFPMTYKRLPYYQPYKVFDQDFIVIVGPILVEKLRRYKSTVMRFLLDLTTLPKESTMVRIRQRHADGGTNLLTGAHEPSPEAPLSALKSPSASPAAEEMPEVEAEEPEDAQNETLDEAPVLERQVSPQSKPLPADRPKPALKQGISLAELRRLVADRPAEPSTGPPKRDAAKEEEREGNIAFYFCANDCGVGQPAQKHLYLLQLQSVFGAQLPKMPKSYVTRIVFDQRHCNLMLIKRDVGVIGGICFRPFYPEGFTEIVFCAITASEQVKGYGTYMMNHLKDFHVRVCRIHHFLTYADEFALGYFQKQGFSPYISLPTGRYHGFIKDYEGATLMECVLCPKMAYTEYRAVLGDIRKSFSAYLDSVQPDFEKTYGGIEHVFQQTPKGQFPSRAQIPGLEGLPAAEQLDEPDLTHLKAIFNKLKAHESAWPFEAPVDADEVPEYYEHIRFPLDLRTVGERLKAGYYVHQRQFVADLRRMFANCYQFNASDTIYYECGYQLNAAFNKLLAAHYPHSTFTAPLPETKPHK